MTSTYTTNKQIEKPAHNDYVDDWDVPVNNNSNIIDASLGSVTAFNVTSVSSHTFSYTELQARTLRFTGTLQSGAVNYLMPNGASGDFIIDNTATTQTDSTSTLTLGWSSGGTSLPIPQGVVIHVYADGGQLVWKYAAAPSQNLLSISLTGVSIGTYTLPLQYSAVGFIEFTGTCANGNVFYNAPSGFKGILNIIGAFTAGGGSSLVAIFPTGGGGGQTISPGHNYILGCTGNGGTVYTLASN